MKKLNPFLLAFLAILTHSLVFGMTYPEVAAMGLLLAKLSFDSYLDSQVNKENLEPLKQDMKRLQEHITRVDNLAKSLNFRK